MLCLVYQSIHYHRNYHLLILQNLCPSSLQPFPSVSMQIKGRSLKHGNFNYILTEIWNKFQKNKVGRTWTATSDWLKAPFLPQSPRTRKERVPSVFAGCSNLWSSACVETKHNPKLQITKTRAMLLFLKMKSAMAL